MAVVNRNILIAIVLIVVLLGGYFALTGQTTQTNNTQQPESSTSQEEEESGVERSVYEGRTPCADCEGIDVRLALRDNYRYRMTSTYLGKDVEPLVESGSWNTRKGDATNPDADVLELTSRDDTKTYFLMTADGLTQLGEDMQPMTDNPYAMNLDKKK